MSAEMGTFGALDALDRGVIGAGQAAAEALARVEQLEARVAAIFTYMEDQTEAWQTWQRVTRPQPARTVRKPGRHLKAIR